MVRVQLPFHLQNLAGLEGELKLDVPAPVSVESIIHCLEARYPTLKGAILERETGKRRPKIRFLTCGQDVSLGQLNEKLPDQVANGEELFMVIGAISGG